MLCLFWFLFFVYVYIVRNVFINTVFRLYQFETDELEKIVNDELQHGQESNKMKQQLQTGAENDIEDNDTKDDKTPPPTKTSAFEIFIGLFVFGYCLFWQKIL